ncbi:MAG TPA: sialate O-acetylesterase [Flavisolibacter sp.]|nr:sialate O-acetylesterase [Flavisolibacter sp.]
MKKPLLAAFCLFLGVFVFAQAPKNVILLLNIGQSNAVGRAQPDPRNEIPPTPGTYWFKKSTNTLEPLIDGIGEDISHATERSMNPMLGKRIKELTGYDVIIVPAAVGNTFISAWQREENALYARAKQIWQAAINYCNTHNITVVNKYAHWLQGENDAGGTETDGYYVMLNDLVNDLVSDMGVEKVFATRIGYDPQYTSSANSEKIMKAQKILNYNHPNFILSSVAPPTFTYANGKMSSDLTHHTLLGLNQVAEEVASAIQLYRSTGGKPVLTENVASLQSVTSGEINLTPNWSFGFNNTLDEANGNVIIKPTHRSWINPGSATYTNEGYVIRPNTGLATSRSFTSNVFTLEMRFKMNTPEAWTAVLGRGRSGDKNKFVLYHNTTTSTVHIEFGTRDEVFAWDVSNINMSSLHTMKLTQANGVLRLFIDGTKIGDDKPSTAPFTMSMIGMGAESHTTDMDGVINSFSIRNTVDNNSTLPLKFKSFKATNIK